jgi:hypothetical protein
MTTDLGYELSSIRSVSAPRERRMTTALDHQGGPAMRLDDARESENVDAIRRIV